MSENLKEQDTAAEEKLLRMSFLERLLFGELDLDKTEQRRRMFIALGIIIAVPIIIILNASGLFETKLLGHILDGIGVVILLLNFAILRKIKKSANLFRFDAFLIGFLFLYYMTGGGKGGGSMMWSFPYPVVVIFLLGRKEGSIWTAVFLVLASVLLFMPLFQDYYPYLQIRYLISFIIISVLAYSIESLRQKFEEESTASIRKLEKALAEVKTLKGLLPICAHCKKVRDDKGYWNRIESYVSERTEAEFTHGLCPDCITELYPEISDEMSKSEQT